MARCTLLYLLQHCVLVNHGGCILGFCSSQVHISSHHDYVRDGYVLVPGKQMSGMDISGPRKPNVRDGYSWSKVTKCLDEYVRVLGNQMSGMDMSWSQLKQCPELKFLVLGSQLSGMDIPGSR